MLKVLFIGDIVGRIGRKAVAKALPEIRKKEKIDIVIANAENAAHGSGITERIIEELTEYGVDYFSTGDHALRRKSQDELYNKHNIIRPANFPPGLTGQGYCLIPHNDKNILFVSLIGRVFMKSHYDCPFRKIDEILANVDLHADNIFAIIIDIHAEATSEKAALSLYLDGKVSAIFGTHTHIQTSDEKIMPKNTAFITDVGMVGADNSSLGVAKEGVIKTYLTQLKYSHVIPEKGPAIFNSVLLKLNTKNGKASQIKRINKTININKN